MSDRDSNKSVERDGDDAGALGDKKVHPDVYGSDVIVVREAEMSAEDIRLEKRKHMKNIILISLAFLMNFNAYQGLARLQSSLHR